MPFEATGLHARSCVCVSAWAHRGDEIGKGRQGGEKGLGRGKGF